MAKPKFKLPPEPFPFQRVMAPVWNQVGLRPLGRGHLKVRSEGKSTDRLQAFKLRGRNGTTYVTPSMGYGGSAMYAGTEPSAANAQNPSFYSHFDVTISSPPGTLPDVAAQADKLWSRTGRYKVVEETTGNDGLLRRTYRGVSARAIQSLFDWFIAETAHEASPIA